MTIGLHIQAHHRVFAGFALHAMAMGSIFPRLPDLKHDLGIGDGVLGLSLIGTALGTLTSLTLASPLLERIGYRTALFATIPLTTLAYAIAVHAPSPLFLFLMFYPVGLAIGCSEILLNVEADRTEAMLGRRIMNRAHSFWSIGFFVTGIIGSAFAYLGISTQWHLALMVPIIGLSVVLLLGRFTPAPARDTNSVAPDGKFTRPTGAILALVAVTLSAMLMEGAGQDWSAIYMRQIFQSNPFIAGVAVAVVMLAQAVARFFADSFVERYSPSSVARFLLACMAAGLVILLFHPSPLTALIGFGLVGLGGSVIFPLAMSAAAQRTDRSAAANVASLAQISFSIFLVGPPLLGLVSERWGIQWVFGVGIPFTLLSIVLAGKLGRKSGGRAALADATY
ncbi:MFS transporter [Agrobacterium tumefaciens]|uniref:MFS transporter n=1 Tax=Agrobacterium tumefaciens TaxID=358 RepID=UPI003BA1176B